jgi:hypothetical protein
MNVSKGGLICGGEKSIEARPARKLDKRLKQQDDLYTA